MEKLHSGPIFQIGVARSGTTILSLMLDSHPRIAVPYESHFFIDYHKNKNELNEKLKNLDSRKEVIKQILDEKYVKGWDYTPTLDSIDLSICKDLAGAIRAIYESYARHHGKDIWGDKTPEYILHIDILNDLFPDAKYIHIVRDGRDVALSLMDQWFGPNDFISALNFWKERVLIGSKMLAMLPTERVFSLKMEELASSPELTLKRLCIFLNVDYDPAMLNSFSQKAASKVGYRIDSHHAGLLGPIDIANVTRWEAKLSKVDQAIAWEKAGATLQELGYKSGKTSHWAKPMRKLYHRVAEIIQYNRKFRKRK